MTGSHDFRCHQAYMERVVEHHLLVPSWSYVHVDLIQDARTDEGLSIKPVYFFASCNLVYVSYVWASDSPTVASTGIPVFVTLLMLHVHSNLHSMISC